MAGLALGITIAVLLTLHKNYLLRCSEPNAWLPLKGFRKEKRTVLAALDHPAWQKVPLSEAVVRFPVLRHHWFAKLHPKGELQPITVCAMTNDPGHCFLLLAHFSRQGVRRDRQQ